MMLWYIMKLRGDCDGDHIMYFVFDGKIINKRHNFG